MASSAVPSHRADRRLDHDWQADDLSEDEWELDLPRRVPSGFVQRDRPRRPYAGRTPPQRARIRRSLQEKRVHTSGAREVQPGLASLEQEAPGDELDSGAELTVEQLLTEEGLPQYAGVFTEEALHSVTFLCDIVERSPDRLRSMLKEIGVTRVGHRERILLAVERVLQSSRQPHETETADAAPMVD